MYVKQINNKQNEIAIKYGEAERCGREGLSSKKYQFTIIVCEMTKDNFRQ